MTSRYGVFSPLVGEGVFSASQPSTPRLAVVNEGGSTFSPQLSTVIMHPLAHLAKLLHKQDFRDAL